MIYMCDEVKLSVTIHWIWGLVEGALNLDIALEKMFSDGRFNVRVTQPMKEGWEPLPNKEQLSFSVVCLRAGETDRAPCRW